MSGRGRAKMGSGSRPTCGAGPVCTSPAPPPPGTGPLSARPPGRRGRAPPASTHAPCIPPWSPATVRHTRRSVGLRCGSIFEKVDTSGFRLGSLPRRTCNPARSSAADRSVDAIQSAHGCRPVPGGSHAARNSIWTGSDPLDRRSFSDLGIRVVRRSVQRGGDRRGRRHRKPRGSGGTLRNRALPAAASAQEVSIFKKTDPQRTPRLRHGAACFARRRIVLRARTDCVWTPRVIRRTAVNARSIDGPASEEQGRSFCPSSPALSCAALPLPSSAIVRWMRRHARSESRRGEDAAHEP